jgi:hypothetical protein
MQTHRLHIHKMARGRLEASIGAGLAAICAACLIPGAPALAASRSASQLRRAFAQTLLALRVTGNAATACSSTTPEGRIALIEMLRGEELYLPSTTCPEAFAGRAPADVEWYCHSQAPIAPELAPVIKQAVIHVRGNRGTVQLVYDFLCGDGETELTGSTAVAHDPMGTSHWHRSHGRWLFDDQPTGTYSPAGRKAAAMLRAALSGRTVTEDEVDPRLRTETVPFCTNGTAQLVLGFTNGESSISAPFFWYVPAGLTAAGSQDEPQQREPPFDAQGDPQGEVSIPTGFWEHEWDVKLVGGAPVVTAPPDVSLSVGAPGTAGC